MPRTPFTLRLDNDLLKQVEKWKTKQEIARGVSITRQHAITEIIYRFLQDQEFGNIPEKKYKLKK